MDALLPLCNIFSPELAWETITRLIMSQRLSKGKCYYVILFEATTQCEIFYRMGDMGTIKLVLSPEEACEALGVKKSTLHKMLMSGEIKSIKIGKLRRIPADGLRTYVERQIAAQDGGQDE
jgi:excisionase family DNA binding protein